MRRVAVIYNERSGAVQGSPAELFQRRGVEAEVCPFDPHTLASDVRELLATGPDAVVVAGGDGTVLAVAEQLLDGDVPLGILPGGTMNILARDLGLPADLEAAADCLLTASIARIDVATVNGRPFLCSSMLAMMPHLGRLREHARDGAGPGAIDLLRRAVRLLRRYPRMRLTITVDGTRHEARTRAVVVSCNPLAAGPPPIPGRDRLDAGVLAAYVTHDRTNWDLATVATKLFRGNWQQDRRIRTYQGSAVEVSSPGLAFMSVMSDGEIAQLTVPLRYDLRPRALAVLSKAA